MNKSCTNDKRGGGVRARGGGPDFHFFENGILSNESVGPTLIAPVTVPKRSAAPIISITLIMTRKLCMVRILSTRRGANFG